MNSKKFLFYKQVGLTLLKMKKKLEYFTTSSKILSHLNLLIYLISFTSLKIQSSFHIINTTNSQTTKITKMEILIMILTLKPVSKQLYFMLTPGLQK